MKNNISNEEIQDLRQTLNIFADVWEKSLSERCDDLMNEYNNMQLINNENWMSLKFDELFNLCLTWKQQFLCNKKDKNPGSLEWLMCILRHNATNYDSILERTSELHAWAPGFGTLMRFRADCLIISFLQKRNLYEQLIKKCHNEWMWLNAYK